MIPSPYRLAVLLKRLEGERNAQCPVCLGWRTHHLPLDGHAEDCELVSCLDGLKHLLPEEA